MDRPESKFIDVKFCNENLTLILNASGQLLAERSAFPELKQIIDSDIFKADHEVETAVTRWLV